MSALHSSHRIGFFLPSLRHGGGERVMVHVANACVSAGHQVDLVVLKRVGEFDSHIDSRVRVINLNAWRMIFSVPKLISYLRKEKPEVMMATDEHTHLLILAAKFISGSRVRTVLRVGNMYSELYSRYSGLKRYITYKLIQLFYKYADAIIANSKGVADDVSRLTGISTERISVIYNPKNLEDIRTQMNENTGDTVLDAKQQPLIVWVGRLRAQKGLPLLIRAFARVRKEMPLKLIFVGGGREEKELKELTKELGVESDVLFVGFKHNVLSYFGKGDVYATASEWEGMSNSLMEAMACGLPVIATDCPSGPRELLAPQTQYAERMSKGVEYAEFGILTAVNDEDAMVEALSVLLTDTEMKKKYRAQSLARAEIFDTDKNVRKYIEVLLP